MVGNRGVGEEGSRDYYLMSIRMAVGEGREEMGRMTPAVCDPKGPPS